ncbi:VOC family protein [Candidatus Berkelbacteria bacterium]|nr:VOC family protein [Candidatus Berkelbacteria bacterium]
MIDHVTIRVADLAKSKAFYEAAFAPLGYAISFGEEGSYWAFDIGDGLFEIAQTEEHHLTPTHVALRMKDRTQVDTFHETAIEAGGRDNGRPGPRSEYGETYYACFVIDPDGHNIEAMHED